MRERIISKHTYEIAATSLLKDAGFDVKPFGRKFLAEKDARLLYMDIAGKQLPYFSRSGKGEFPWETHFKSDRLNRISDMAKKAKAEPWFCFCYYLREPEYKSYFKNLKMLGSNIFGIRLIGLEAFRSKRLPRSWGTEYLPRKEVLKLTIEATDI